MIGLMLTILITAVPSGPPGHGLPLREGGDDNSRAVVCPPLPQPPTPGCIAPPPDSSEISVTVAAAGEERERRGLPLPPQTPAAEILAARLRVADLSHALHHANIALAELLAARGRNANSNSSAYTQ